MTRKLNCLMLAILLLLSIAVTANAHDVPDLDRKGTLTLTMDWAGEKLNGGSLTLYRVGDVTENDGNYSFTIVAALNGSGLSLEDLSRKDLAKDLAAQAHSSRLPAITADIRWGKAVFTDLTAGLYVVTQSQEQASEGFAPIAPFLISMPKNENGTYVYEVTADPKVPLETAPTEPTKPAEKPSGNLPQTGQLNWPVPLLTASGLLMIVIGWMLRSEKKKSNNN